MKQQDINNTSLEAQIDKTQQHTKHKTSNATTNMNIKQIKQCNLDKKTPPNPDLEYGLESLFREYDKAIDSIDFRLNTHKVRKDIEGRTKSFMKKRK